MVLVWQENCQNFNVLFCVRFTDLVPMGKVNVKTATPFVVCAFYLNPVKLPAFTLNDQIIFLIVPSGPRDP